MSNKITIQIDRPTKDQTIKDIALMVAAEIMALMKDERQKETIEFWHNKMAEWKITDRKVELRMLAAEKRNGH